MIAHREEKRCADVPGGGQKRDTILFSPIRIFDEGRRKAAPDQPLELCNHALAFVADDEVDP